MNVEQAENVLAKAADIGLQIQLGTNMRYMPPSPSRSIQTPSLADDVDWSKSIHIQNAILINEIRNDSSLSEAAHSVSR